MVNTKYLRGDMDLQNRYFIMIKAKPKLTKNEKERLKIVDDFPLTPLYELLWFFIKMGLPEYLDKELIKVQKYNLIAKFMPTTLYILENDEVIIP